MQSHKDKKKKQNIKLRKMPRFMKVLSTWKRWHFLPMGEKRIKDMA